MTKKPQNPPIEQAILPVDLGVAKEAEAPLKQSCGHPEPSLDKWRELYALAKEIKSAAPWHFIDEQDLFALVDPKTGEKGYIAVMGGAGEHFAIAIFLGDEGLSSYIDMQEQVLDPWDLYIGQKCLMLSFEDRDYVKPQDRKIYKFLELRFRGRKQYPLFRFHEPGFEPWFIDADQADLLLLALPLVVQVAREVQEDPDYLFNAESSSSIRIFTLEDDDPLVHFGNRALNLFGGSMKWGRISNSSTACFLGSTSNPHSSLSWRSAG